MTKPSPWRFGFVDAVMNRPSKCPFNGYPAQEAYLRGYMTGKSLAVAPSADILEFKKPTKNGE
jgi:hypothetical protein